MKTILAIALLGILPFIGLKAQTLIEQFPSSKLSMITTMNSDENGNVFIGLMFKGDLQVGGESFSAPNSAYLLIKRDQNGNVLWSKQCPFTIYDLEPRTGGVKILASANKPFVFLGKTYNAEHYAAFFIELDANGDLKYFEEFSSSTDNVFATAMDVDEEGNTAILLSLDKNIHLQGKIIDPGMDKRGIVIMLNNQNKLKWSFPFCGGNSFITGVWADALTIDAAGNIYVGGNISGVNKFGALSITTAITHFGPGEELYNNECFLLKISANGTPEFVKKIITDANINDMDFTVSGNLIIAGYFKGVVTEDNLGLSKFGDQEFRSTLDENNTVTEDGYIACYSPAGELVWVARSNGKSSDRIQDIEIDCEGNIYACGMNMMDGKFTGTSSSSEIIVNQGIDADRYNSDLVLLKLNPNGELQWFKMGGSVSSDRFEHICFNGQELFVGGFIKGNSTFDGMSFNMTCPVYEAIIASYKLECKR